MPMTFGIQIAAPPEDVFSYVADIVRHPDWANPKSKLEMEKVSDGEFVSKAMFFGKPITAKIKLTQVSPSSSLSFNVEESSGRSYIHTFTFTPQQGGTFVRRTMDDPEPTLGKRIMGVLAKPAIKSDSMASLTRLKSKLEHHQV